MASSYFDQTKYYVPEVMKFIEPNPIFDDGQMRKKLVTQKFSKDANNTNEIVLLYQASEGYRQDINWDCCSCWFI